MKRIFIIFIKWAIIFNTLSHKNLVCKHQRNSKQQIKYSTSYSVMQFIFSPRLASESVVTGLKYMMTYVWKTEAQLESAINQ